MTLGSFRRKKPSNSVPLSPVFSEDGRSIAPATGKIWDGKTSLDFPHPDFYIPRTGDFILSPAFILTGYESASNLSSGVAALATIFPDGYSLVPTSNEGRVSTDSTDELEVPPHVVRPEGLIRQDSATLPQEFGTPGGGSERQDMMEEDDLYNSDPTVEPRGGGISPPAPQSGSDNDHGGTTAVVTQTAAVAPGGAASPVPAAPLPFRTSSPQTPSPLIRPESPHQRGAATSDSRSSPSRNISQLPFKDVKPSSSPLPFTVTPTQNVPLSQRLAASQDLHSSDSEGSMRSLHSSSERSHLSSGGSGRASPLRKVSTPILSSSPSSIRPREKLFDSTKRLMTGSKIESVTTLRQSASSADASLSQQRRNSLSLSNADSLS